MCDIAQKVAQGFLRKMLFKKQKPATNPEKNNTEIIPIIVPFPRETQEIEPYESNPLSKPWEVQRKLKQIPIPTPQEILNIGLKISDDKLRALFSILYLTGARIDEVARSLRKKDIEIIERDGRKIALFTLRNEKHKNRRFKQIPIPLDREIEKEIFKLAIPHLDTLQLDEYVWDYIGDYGRRLLVREIGINSHWLRHIRASHLVTYYDFNEHLLMLFMGWTDGRPAKHYMELRWFDLLQKI